MKKCGLHLPGNIQCPYEAFWRITFQVNEPRAYESTPPRFRTLDRHVCGFHLEAAIMRELEIVPASSNAVSVSLLSLPMVPS